MKTPAQKGPIGTWLTETRKARGYRSGARARVDIERLTGWRIPPSVYAEWEAGTRIPDEKNLDKLEKFFGKMPEEARLVSGDQTALVMAIDRNTDAITALAEHLKPIAGLVDELKKDRAAQLATNSAFEAALGDLAKALDGLGKQLGVAPSSRGTPAPASGR